MTATPNRTGLKLKRLVKDKRNSQGVSSINVTFFFGIYDYNYNFYITMLHRLVNNEVYNVLILIYQIRNYTRHTRLA